MDRNTCDLARASFPLGDGFAAVPDAPRARLGPSERLPPVVASSGPAAWRSPRDGVPRPARVRAPVRGDVLRLLRPEPHGAQPEPNRGLLRVRRRRARRQAGRADLRGVLPARLARDARHRAAVRRRAAQAGARRDARARPGPVPPDRLRDGVLAAVRAARAHGHRGGGRVAARVLHHGGPVSPNLTSVRERDGGHLLFTRLDVRPGRRRIHGPDVRVAPALRRGGCSRPRRGVARARLRGGAPARGGGGQGAGRRRPRRGRSRRRSRRRRGGRCHRRRR